MEKDEGGDFPPKKVELEGVEAIGVDYPAAKKLARQLDFTPPVVPLGQQGGKVNHQPPLLSQMARPSLAQHRQQGYQQGVPQLQQNTIMMQQQQPQALPIVSSIRPVKPESPRTRPRQNTADAKDSNPLIFSFQRRGVPHWPKLIQVAKQT